MTRSRKYLSAVAVAAGVLIAAGISGPAASQDGDGTIGEGLVMYFQMGGNPGAAPRWRGPMAPAPQRKRSASTCASSIPLGSPTS